MKPYLKFGILFLSVLTIVLAAPFAYFSAIPVAHISTSGSTSPVTPSGEYPTAQSYGYNFSVIIHNSDLFANQTMLSQGFSPSCRAYCFLGITYTLDPTVVITNYGRDFEQCKVFNSSGTITCVSSASDKAIFMGISSATGTISATNTTCSGIITAGGLADIAGTVTAGASGTTVTTTISHTWTAAETDTAIQVFCLQTELHSGSHVYLYFVGNFGPDTLTTGNTITLVASIART